jgi:hypothetical protein
MTVRAALETALNTISPSLLTAWENVPFTVPAPATPYQMAHLLLAQPDNVSMGGTTFQEIGIFQVTLLYPQQSGAAAAEARATLVRDTFRRGRSFTASGKTVTIERTPEITPGRNEDGRFVIPIRIRFFAHIIE